MKAREIARRLLLTPDLEIEMGDVGSATKDFIKWQKLLLNAKRFSELEKLVLEKDDMIEYLQSELLINQESVTKLRKAVQILQDSNPQNEKSPWVYEDPEGMGLPF